MSGNVRVTAIFSEFQKSLDDEQELREVNYRLLPKQENFISTFIYVHAYNFATYWNVLINVYALWILVEIVIKFKIYVCIYSEKQWCTKSLHFRLYAAFAKNWTKYPGKLRLYYKLYIIMNLEVRYFDTIISAHLQRPFSDIYMWVAILLGFREQAYVPNLSTITQNLPLHSRRQAKPVLQSKRKYIICMGGGRGNSGLALVAQLHTNT